MHMLLQVFRVVLPNSVVILISLLFSSSIRMVIGDMGATSCSAKLPFGIHSILYERKPHQITVDTDRTCCDTNRCVIPMRVTPIYYDGIAPPWIASSSSISTCTTTTKSSQQQQHINTSSSTLPSSASHHTKKHDQSQSRHDMTRRIGHPYQSRAPAKHKKPRTSFSKKQIALLESRFLSQKYLASTERASLASELHMSDAQVKTWFQNRRTKWRRQEAEEKEFEDKANARMLSYTQCFFARPDITL